MAKVTNTLKKTRLLYKRIRIALTGQGYCAQFGETAVTWLWTPQNAQAWGSSHQLGPRTLLKVVLFSPYQRADARETGRRGNRR